MPMGFSVFFFFWFSREVLEKSNQAAQKPDFLLKTTNDDLKQKNEN